MKRLPLLDRTLDRGLGLGLVDGLGAAVRRGPGDAGGLSAALLELVTVDLAANSARVSWRRSSTYGCSGWTTSAVN
ncbi:hypothetical protein ACWDD9_37530 [Kitasatospora sp. NPDC001119]